MHGGEGGLHREMGEMWTRGRLNSTIRALKVPKHEKCRNQQLTSFKDMILGGSRDYHFSQKASFYPFLLNVFVRKNV